MTYVIIVVLVALSGLFSGLTLGLLGLNKTELERKVKLGDEKAKKIYSIRKNGNLLLCTLLFGNIAVNSALSIFLGNITTGIIAGVLATGLIVIFGEIIPQAAFSRHALDIGSRTVGVVKLFIILFYPFTRPLAWFLDKIFGEEMPTIWTKAELREIIKLHEDSTESDLDKDEERIMLGALSYSHKKVSRIMTPKEIVFALDEETKLGKDLYKEIKEKGFSRVPVYRKNLENIVGILYIKDILGVKEGVKIKNIAREKFLRTNPDEKIDILLNRFSKSKLHLAVIKDKDSNFMGVVSLEDIIEEIFRIEIVDETDTIVDLQKEAERINGHLSRA